MAAGAVVTAASIASIIAIRGCASVEPEDPAAVRVRSARCQEAGGYGAAFGFTAGPGLIVAGATALAYVSGMVRGGSQFEVTAVPQVGEVNGIVVSGRF